ncbi:MAG TPA: hypothetical protein VL524_12520 [Gemmatimonadaceae bacterium]|nr:hypothetical protein [Gemmatimonadaceae bacterium]
MLRKVAVLLAVATTTFAIAACSEKLDAGKSCPLLCPEQAISLVDTTIDAVFGDTTVLGLPPIGSETYLMLASHGDTVETRAIVRFDTLQQSFTAANNADSTITKLDSAVLVLPIAKPDSAHRPSSPITIEVYDVDTAATDTVASILGSLFRPDRFLGSKTFAPESLLDTLRVPISPDSVLARIDSGTHLRVGLRLVTPATQGYDLRIGTTNGGNSASLRLRPSSDTAVKPLVISPVSRTPANEPFLSGPLVDYTIVLVGQTTTPATELAVGGIPSRRSLLRFNIPSRIIDSTTVVRASLQLTQAPNRRVDPHDSVYVFPLAILATPAVSDPATLLRFVSSAGLVGLDSLRMAPADSGVRSFEIVGLVRTWRNQPQTVSPRALGLLSGAEAQLPAEIDFFSSRASAAVRPRLRITYVPQTSYGVP